MDNYQRFCRVCLQKPTEEDFISFDTPFEGHEANVNHMPFTYLDCFRICTQLEVDQHDMDTPQGLCVACEVELSMLYEFLQKAKKSDGILRESIKTKEDFHGDEYTAEKNFLPVVFFLCDVCKQTFMTKASLDLHFLQCNIDQSDKVKLNAEQEQKCFSEPVYEIPQDIMEVEILNHENSNTESNVNDVSIDDDDFCTSPINFDMSEALENRHNLPRQNQCKVCQIEIKKGDSMRQHLKENHSRIVQCTKCSYEGKEFQMNDHMAELHEGVSEFVCNICSKQFSTNVQLNAHIKYHERKTSKPISDACNICGKRFSTKSYLRQHQVTHRTERDKFQCSECRKVYISKGALETHMRLHQKESGSTVVCEICGKHFPRNYELMIHKRFHKRERPFPCEFCPKSFAIKGHLRTHMWRHEGLKLKCDNCDKLFSSTKALTEHSYTHTTMPFPCNYCTKGYPSKQKYKVHLESNHGRTLTSEEFLNFKNVTRTEPLKRKKLTLVKVGIDPPEEYLDEFLLWSDRRSKKEN